MVRGRALAGAILAAAVLSAGPVAAQTPAGAGEAEPESDARARTRALANEGMRAFRRGDYVTALSRFEQAEAIVPAPTIALQRARSLEKLGRLAEALERYAAIASAAVPAEAPYVHHRAQQDAQAAMLALEARVPTVTVIVEGAPGPGAELVVDGRAAAWAAGADRVVRRLDPGPHRFELRRRDGTRAAGGVTLTERQQTDVRLTLPPPRDPGASGEAGAPADASREGGWEHQRTAGWIAVSAGGVGLGLALITGAAAIVIGGDLSDRCPGGNCPPEAWDDVDTHDSFRGASTVGFLFAGAFGAAGAVLLLTAPDASSASSSRPGTTARAGLGPRGLTLRVDY